MQKSFPLDLTKRLNIVYSVIAKNYSSEAIVLARRNYSEADRILVVLTKNFGKISLLAKGVRLPKSKKRGHLEVFSHIKFSASKGKSLDLITEAEMIDSYAEIRANLKKVSVAYFFMEGVGRLIHEGEKNEQLFNFMLDYLNKLRESSHLRKLRLNYIYDILVILGFWPKGRRMDNPDFVLEEVTERKLTSLRVGKKLFS